MKQCNDVQSDFKEIGRALCTLNLKADFYYKTNSNVFWKSNKDYFLLCKWWNFPIQDYAERLYTHFDQEIQSNYFGNGSSLSIETFNVKCLGINHNSPYEFHSYLSDNSGQYLSIIHAHIISMLNEL